MSLYKRPQTDFCRVRLPWESIFVNRETAARILAAASGFGPPKIIRCETIAGSAVYVRTDTIMIVSESTKAQGDLLRRSSESSAFSGAQYARSSVRSRTSSEYS